MKPKIDEISLFLTEYAANMLSVGTYTARVNRCVGRIARAYGYSVSMTAFTKHFSISVTDLDDSSNFRTYVKNVSHKFVSFRLISDLSALSWQIFDERVTLAQARTYFDEIMKISQNDALKMLFFVSIANAAFCRLFGGDLGGVFAVFFATLFGFYLKNFMSKKGVNLKLQYIILSFISSFLAYLGVHFGLSNTADITIGSSVLYLIPGVKLINSIFDILNENILVGISNGISTGILMICIAVGVYMTIFISNVGILNV